MTACCTENVAVETTAAVGDDASASGAVLSNCFQHCYATKGTGCAAMCAGPCGASEEVVHGERCRMDGIGSTWKRQIRGRAGALVESGWTVNPGKAIWHQSAQEYVHGADIQILAANWKSARSRMNVESTHLKCGGAAPLDQLLSAATAVEAVDADAAKIGIAAAAVGVVAGEGAVALKLQRFLGRRSCLILFLIPIQILLRVLLLYRLRRQRQMPMTMRMLA